MVEFVFHPCGNKMFIHDQVRPNFCSKNSDHAITKIINFINGLIYYTDTKYGSTVGVNKSDRSNILANIKNVSRYNTIL